MSEKPAHDATSSTGATTIHASKGGGATKWLLGAAAAAVLLGGGYFAWKSMTPGQSQTETAYNEPYAEDPLRAGPLEPGQTPSAETAATDESNAATLASTETRTPATRTTAPARRSASRPTPEETIGVTPINATADEIQDSDEIVVTAQRRPLWVRTPSARRLSSFYPERALQRGREGEASLHCTVQDSGALACVRVEETPGGFGSAALRVARTLRHAPRLADGSDAAGSPVNLHVVFRMADGQQRG